MLQLITKRQPAFRPLYNFASSSCKLLQFSIYPASQTKQLCIYLAYRLHVLFIHATYPHFCPNLAPLCLQVLYLAPKSEYILHYYPSFVRQKAERHA